jgi:hypothetical protein
MKPYIAFAVLAALAPHAAAQQQAARPHPADPAAPVPAVKYESAFSGYRSFREEPLAPWRDVNDEVARVGGHAGVFGGAGHVGHGAAKPTPKPQTPEATPSPKTRPQPTQHGIGHR